MPKFSQPEMVDMSDVFKSHPRPEVRIDLVNKYRAIATKHLQETIPAQIKALEALIEAESDPSSPCYAGHVETAAYTQPMLLQPADAAAQSLSDSMRALVMPRDISRAQDVGHPATNDLEDDSDADTLVVAASIGSSDAAMGSVHSDVHAADAPRSRPARGVRAGAHWFETLAQNKVQNEFIQLANKRFEEMQFCVQDLRIWLELEIPLIEDGNSFGAEVQEQLIRSLLDATKQTVGWQNGCRQHYSDRLKLAQEWAKFPNLMDYPAAIAASDRLDHVAVRSYIRRALVKCGGLLTQFERNWAKVINPKGEASSGGMY